MKEIEWIEQAATEWGKISVSTHRTTTTGSWDSILILISFSLKSSAAIALKPSSLRRPISIVAKRWTKHQNQLSLSIQHNGNVASEPARKSERRKSHQLTIGNGNSDYCIALIAEHEQKMEKREKKTNNFFSNLIAPIETRTRARANADNVNNNLRDYRANTQNWWRWVFFFFFVFLVFSPLRVHRDVTMQNWVPFAFRVDSKMRTRSYRNQSFDSWKRALCHHRTMNTAALCKHNITTSDALSNNYRQLSSASYFVYVMHLSFAFVHVRMCFCMFGMVTSTALRSNRVVRSVNWLFFSFQFIFFVRARLPVFPIRPCTITHPTETVGVDHIILHRNREKMVKHSFVAVRCRSVSIQFRIQKWFLMLMSIQSKCTDDSFRRTNELSSRYDIFRFCRIENRRQCLVNVNILSLLRTIATDFICALHLFLLLLFCFGATQKENRIDFCVCVNAVVVVFSSLPSTSEKSDENTGKLKCHVCAHRTANENQQKKIKRENNNQMHVCECFSSIGTKSKCEKLFKWKFY